MPTEGVWWRAYANAVDNHKLQVLPPVLFKHWFNLLCVYKAFGGVFPQDDIIAAKLRVPVKSLPKIFADLHQRELMDIQEGLWIPHDWDSRQFQSDTSTERTRRFREKHKRPDAAISEGANGNVSSNVPGNGVGNVPGTSHPSCARAAEQSYRDTDTTEEQTPPLSPRIPSSVVEAEKTETCVVGIATVPLPQPDLWAAFWFIFVAAGKPLCDRDKERALQRWLNYDEPEHERIVKWAVEQAKHRWSDEKHTPMPANALDSQGWRRVAAERIIPDPKPPTKMDELAQAWDAHERRNGRR